GAACPCEVAGEEVGRSARVLGCIRGSLFGEIGREPLVVGHYRNTDHVGERFDEALRLGRLLATLAAQGQWHPDDDALGLLFADQGREACEPVAGRGALNHAEGPRDRAGRVRDGDAGPRPAEVQRENLHSSALAIACLPASRASRSPPGFFPPASASVARPPPPPPMWRPMSRPSFDAARPRATSDSSRFTTR